MKQIFFKLLLAALLMTSFTPAVWAEIDVDINEHTWGDKLNRGLLNIVSSPLEIARSINEGNQDEGYAYGWTVGLLQGLGRTGLRLGAGVIEVVTTPFDFPKDNKAPIVEPEFVWQDWGKGPRVD